MQTRQASPLGTIMVFVFLVGIIGFFGWHSLSTIIASGSQVSQEHLMVKGLFTLVTQQPG